MSPKLAGRANVDVGRANMIARQGEAETASQKGVVGIVWGAPILTMQGVKTIQSLRPGDSVITRDRGAVSVSRIRQISCLARAVYFLAGSSGLLGTNRDSLLPAEQPVLIRDWRATLCARQPQIIRRAADLVDGEHVRDIGFHPMTVFEIYCGEPHILYADGLELGTADMRANRFQPLV